jgi:hypothetical protein
MMPRLPSKWLKRSLNKKERPMSSSKSMLSRKQQKLRNKPKLLLLKQE